MLIPGRRERPLLLGAVNGVEVDGFCFKTSKVGDNEGLGEASGGGFLASDLSPELSGKADFL